jgi:hypothetical protein
MSFTSEAKQLDIWQEYIIFLKKPKIGKKMTFEIKQIELMERSWAG